MSNYRVAGTFSGQSGRTRIEPDASGLFIELPEPEWPVKIGDIVEDRRPKSVFQPDPDDCYPGDPGTVIAVTATGFRVRWEYRNNLEMGYAWAWLGRGIDKREEILP